MRQTLENKERVLRVLSHESVFDHINDDGSSDINDLDKHVTTLLSADHIITLSPSKDTVIICIPWNYVTYDIHISVMDGPERINAVENIHKCGLWLLKNTQARKFITQVPEYHRVASVLAYKCGMKKEGVLKEAFLKNGKLRDLILYGITDKELIDKMRGD